VCYQHDICATRRFGRQLGSLLRAPFSLRHRLLQANRIHEQKALKISSSYMGWRPPLTMSSRVNT
jgi:hypothetical protein